MKVGIIIGRFQTPYLTEGHKHLIDTAISECDRVVIILGYSSSMDRKNPLSVASRVEMIYQQYPLISIDTIKDVTSDEVWSKRLDLLAAMYGTDITLYGSRDSFSKVYAGKYPIREVEEIEGVSATAVREEVSIVNSEDFRRGVIWATNQLTIGQNGK